ncbi:glycosyltransferase family 2 protein [Pilimelia terevasa]|uniref:glycosyltransferase family 2 protein n=1 Tax=Pilimelia terevasa TaxID=53372 RepID=UPI00166C9A7B|nr:glycosyltransferase family A protein [Pilimelia terevasa]
MDAAIVIPCRNATAVIGRQLRALSRQVTDRSWTVVVVDDGSHDDLAAVVDAHRHVLPQILYLRRDRGGGTGSARNVGARATDTTALLFLDADDEVAEDYVDAMLRALDASPLVCARIDYTRLNSQRVLGRLPNGHAGRTPAESDFLPFIPGGLMGMSRALFDELGGMSEELPALADVDMSWRAQLAGHAVALAETTVAVEMRSTALGQLRRGRFQGRDVVELYDRFADSGAPRHAVLSHVAGWLRLVARLPAAALPGCRTKVSWELGWLVGVAAGLSARRRTVTGARGKAWASCEGVDGRAG